MYWRTVFTVFLLVVAPTYCVVITRMKNKRALFLQWVIEESNNLDINTPSARAFMRSFPPPESARVNEITHVTKKTFKFDEGPPMEASINYMYGDGTGTSYVATLGQVREWARQ